MQIGFDKKLETVHISSYLYDLKLKLSLLDRFEFIF